MTVALRFMPCAEFELEIHSYVDGELDAADARQLVVHLELCSNCREAVEALRKQVRIHREALDIGRLSAGFDRVAGFGSLSTRLLIDNLSRVANLFYELGKAYFVAANDSKLSTYILKKAAAIQKTRVEGRQLVKETAGLLELSSGATRRQRETVKRSSQLFRNGRAAKVAARPARSSLDNARLYLEECLILDPGHAAARLYLGVYYQRIDRPDEAIQEYRKLLGSPELSREMRAMTLQALGNAHAYRLDYEGATSCYEEIMGLGVVGEDPRFFSMLVSLAISLAKLGRFERSVQVFGELVERFPQMLKEARAFIDQAEVFRNVLRTRSQYRAQLVERYPMLFAG